MLIRGQDKKKIFNLQNIGCIEIEPYFYKGENYLIAAKFPGRVNEIIAVYSTEEKAIKVLDMIQIEYECSLYCNDAFDNAALVERPYIFAANRTFQMPQDSEVRP